MNMQTCYQTKRRAILILVLIAALALAGCGEDSDSADMSNQCNCEGIGCFFAVVFIPILPVICSSSSSATGVLDLGMPAGETLLEITSPVPLQDYYVGEGGDVIELAGTVTDPPYEAVDMDYYQGPTLIISNISSGLSWLAEVGSSLQEGDRNSYTWRSNLSFEEGRMVPGPNRIVVEADYGGGIYASTEVEFIVIQGSVIL